MASLFSATEDITVNQKGVEKLLDGLNVYKVPGPDRLNECSNEISPILALIFNESLARVDVPDDWREANFLPVLKKVKDMLLLIKDWCLSYSYTEQKYKLYAFKQK